MDSKGKASQVFNSTPGIGLRDQPKNRGWNCVHADNNKSKIKNKKGR